MTNIKSLTTVILPILRRVMPSVIANEIIGVQPMSGPTGSIFGLRSQYSYRPIHLTNEHYNKFVRIYNRRYTHTLNDILNAKYPTIRFAQWSTYDECKEWCIDMYGKSGYIEYNYNFFFLTNDDLVAFKMRWL